MYTDEMEKALRYIKKQLAAHASDRRHQNFNDSYFGSGHQFWGVSVPVRRRILKEFLKEGTYSTNELKQLVELLVHAPSHEEKTMAAYLLGYRADVRAAVALRDLDNWLEELVGWAEIDALCYSVFPPQEILAQWNAWRVFLQKLARNENIHKRRSSLVFLTGATAKSSDIRLHTLAYQTIDRLSHEKDILITKAISWLLRSMSDTRKKEVAQYLRNHADTLPKIAVRETHRKLETGKKNR